MAQAIIKTIHPNKVHLRPPSPKSTTIPLSHIQQTPHPIRLPISTECSPASACLINNRNPVNQPAACSLIRPPPSRGELGRDDDSAGADFLQAAIKTIVRRYRFLSRLRRRWNQLAINIFCYLFALLRKGYSKGIKNSETQWMNIPDYRICHRSYWFVFVLGFEPKLRFLKPNIHLFANTGCQQTGELNTPDVNFKTIYPDKACLGIKNSSKQFLLGREVFYKSGFKGGNYCQRAANGGPSWGAWRNWGGDEGEFIDSGRSIKVKPITQCRPLGNLGC
ncbi:hypothetical protein CEXT_115241 [Caerostris extrusa]|uniref:Uncharacterized protein n=1 Tax=Caerostris extrusa TaxID=172846 RepID=A0AAV4Y4Q7_CAEEX|nr:hypothetical protein CEXT_115241 [Caerostris extrusa]